MNKLNYTEQEARSLYQAFKQNGLLNSWYWDTRPCNGEVLSMDNFFNLIDLYVKQCLKQWGYKKVNYTKAYFYIREIILCCFNECRDFRYSELNSLKR